MKIAILRRNGLGDLLCSYPLLCHLRKKYPCAEVTLFVEERNAPLAHHLSGIDKIVVLKSKGNRYLEHIRKALLARKERFDIAISAKTSPMKLASLFLFLLGAKERFAYVEKKRALFFINRGKIYDRKKHLPLHQALKSIQLIDPKVTKISPQYFPKIHLSDDVSMKYSYNLPHPVLLLSATSYPKQRELSADRYSEIVNRFSEARKLSIVIIAEEKDASRASQIKNGLKVPCEVFLTKSFEEFLSRMKAADFAFVMDGGAAHVAAGFDVPSFVLFGKERPENWRPLSEKCEVLYHPQYVDCLSDDEILSHLRGAWKKWMRKSTKLASKKSK